MPHSHPCRPGFSRRDLLLGSAAGMALAGTGFWGASHDWDLLGKDRLAKEYKGKMDDTLKKFFTEVGRVRGFPAGKEVLMEIKPVVIIP